MAYLKQQAWKALNLPSEATLLEVSKAFREKQETLTKERREKHRRPDDLPKKSELVKLLNLPVEATLTEIREVCNSKTATPEA